jgi:hypothetical protein
MPDEKGKLTEEDFTKIRMWLTSFGLPAPHCPFCGSDQWSIGPHLVQPVTLGPAYQLQLGGFIGYPQIAVVSTKCGHTMFINAVVAGLLPPAPEQ